MTHSVVRFRRRAFAKQAGRCYYCKILMWLDSPGTLPAWCGLTDPQLAQLKATAEHLLARMEGGRDCAGNIVAACRWCNQTRHRLKKPPPPEEYRIIVQRRLARRRWHPAWVFDAGLILTA